MGTEQHSPDFDGDRLITDKITPPIQAETSAMNAALDYLGYTGPRQIRLLLAVDYT